METADIIAFTIIGLFALTVAVLMVKHMPRHPPLSRLMIEINASMARIKREIREREQLDRRRRAWRRAQRSVARPPTARVQWIR